MKNYTKIGIICIVCLMALLALTPVALGEPTTIGDSTYPASEDEYYRWTCTYCHPSADDYYGEGSYYNVTIGTIYQGSYMAITNALIVSAIWGEYLKGPDQHTSYIEPFLCVYNASLHYIYLEFPLIVPIPLNLTMIAEFMMAEWGGSAVVSGNAIVVTQYNVVQIYNYNSDGFCTSLTWDSGGERMLTFKLGGGGGGDEIPFDNYFIIPTVITIGVIVIFVKKRRSINNYK